MRIISDILVPMAMTAISVLFLWAADSYGAPTTPTWTSSTLMSSTNITTSYVQLSSSTAGMCTALDVFNSGAYPIKLALGASGSEIAIGYTIPPSMVGPWRILVSIKGGLRLSATSVGTSNATGYLIVNCLM